MFATVGTAAEAPVVDTRISIEYDGTPAFDGTNYGPGVDGQYGSSNTDPLAVDNTDPGNDDSDSNGAVRNGDNIGYKIQVSLNGSLTSNVISTVTLSAGQTFQQIPSKCKSGSLISPDKLTLTCNIGSLSEGVLVTFIANAKIPASTLNNTSVNASISTTADGANTATDSTPFTITTGAPKVNLIKVVLDRGKPFDTIDPVSSEPGKVVRYGIGVYGDKGSEELDGSPIFFTDDLSYVTNPPKTYKLYDWGTSPACGQNTNKGALLPYGSIGILPSSIDRNSVTDSGTFACNQAGGAGTSIDVSISGYDSSGESVPRLFPDRSAISQGQNFFIAGYIDIWVPLDNLIDPANDFGGDYQLETNNTFSTIDPVSKSGLSNYGASTEPSSDNDAYVVHTQELPGDHDRQFSFDGENSLSSKTGTVKSYAGGLVYPLINLAVSYETRAATCAKIDTSEITLTGNYLSPGTARHFQRARQVIDKSPFASGFSLGPDGVANTSDDGIDLDYFVGNAAPGALGRKVAYIYSVGGFVALTLLNPDDFNVAVEYSSVPISDYQTDTCNDDEDSDTISDWVIDPTTDPARFPNGWASVTRIRVQADFPNVPDPLTQANSVQFFPELKINPALNPAAGLGFGNAAEPDAFVGIYGSSITYKKGTWDHGSVASGVNDPFDGDFADRVELVSAQLRTNKTTTGIPYGSDVALGQVIGYKIESTFAGGVTATADIKLTDTLDSNLTYKSASTIVTPGSSGILVNGVDPSVNPNIEPVISGNELVWTLTNVPVGATLPIVDYKATVSVFAPSGSLANVVVIEEINGVPIDSQSTVQEKTSAASVVVNTPGDFDVVKLLTTPANSTVELDQNLEFDLTYANTSASQDVNELEFIEVFPFNGDGPRDPVSAFSDDDNKLEFVSINGSLGGETYLYTSAVPSSISNDPCHVSNTGVGDPSPVVCSDGFVDSAGNSAPSATGTTAWFDCSGGFGVGPCPIAKSAVTAIKAKIAEPSPGVPALATGSARQKFSLVLKPSGNKSGDVYTNNFGSRISESELVAVSNDVSVSVVDSSLGDRLWFDLNGDGVQDVGEPGISGVVVNLYDSLNVLVDSDVTDANGNYKFDKLVSGDYSVRVDSTTLPNGLSGTFDKDGLGTLDRADGSLVENVDDVSYDFGYRGVGSVSGRLWNDVDADGVQDPGEAGFSNFVVTVTYFGLDGVRGGTDDVAFTTTTDTNGDYSLTGLPLGNYSISVTPPSGFDQTFEFDDSFNNSLLFSLSGTSPSVVNQDFGYAKSSEVGGISTPSSGVLSRTGVQVFGVVSMASLLIMSGLLLARRKKTT